MLKKSLQFMVVACFATGISAQSSQPSTDLPSFMSLKQALEIGLQNNAAFRAAQEAARVAEAEAVSARLRPNPVFLLNSESYPLYTTRPGSFFNNQELIMNISQEIETAGKRVKRTEVARAQIGTTMAEIQDAQRRLRLAIQEAYFQTALAKADLELAQQNLAEFDQLLNLGRARFERGEISGLDFKRIEIERLKFFNDRLTAEVALKNTKAALLTLLGFEQVSADFDVADALGVRPAATTLDTMRRDALESRPDLIGARMRIERAQADIRLQEALRVPNIAPFFGYKRNEGVNTSAFGVQIPLPFLNRNQGEIARAYAERNRESFLLRQVETSVLSEVQQAYNSWAGSLSRVETLERDYLPKAREVATGIQQSFRLGAADLITFLDAQRAYREIVRAFNQSLFEAVINRYRLEFAVGKDLQ